MSTNFVIVLIRKLCEIQFSRAPTHACARMRWRVCACVRALAYFNSVSNFIILVVGIMYLKQ